jgi:predicted metal-dependent phosphoesterase TrpH
MNAASLIDLHMHTTFSDGRLSPTELVDLLASRGLRVASITDHDTTDGLEEAITAASHHPGLLLVPGIEISADHPSGQGDVHILGYFIDYHEPGLQARLLQLQNERKDRGKHMVERLTEIGLPVDWERVVEISGDGSVGRPHIAQAMVEKGYIASVKEAFDGYLDDAGKAYVDRPRISIEETVALINGAGGVAVLAHPMYVHEFEALLPQLAEIGMVGMEVYYSEFGSEDQARLARLAEANGLLPCGGSDYHGIGSTNEHLPGAAGPPMEVFNRLAALASSRKAAL